MCVCVCVCVCVTYLGGVDASLLEGAAGGIVGTQVAVLAPVAAEGTVHTGETPGQADRWTGHTLRKRLRSSNGEGGGEWGARAKEETSLRPKWAPAVVPLWLAQHLSIIM